MGALTSNRKRSDEFLSLNHGNFSPNFQSSSKRPRFSSMQKSGNPDRAVLSSKSAVAKVSRYPEAKTPLPRVHAPCRTLKFGYNLAVSLRDSSPQRHKKEGHGNAMGNFLVSKYYKAKNCALEACRFLQKEKEVIELDKDVDEEKTVSEDSSIEEVEVIEDDEPENARALVPNSKELDAQALDCSNQLSSSSAASDLLNADQKVENLSLSAERDISSVSVYKKLLSIVDKRTSRLEDLNYEIVLNEKRRSAIQSLRPKKEPVEEVPREPFIPLTEEEEAEVKRALSVNGRKVLVAHENSNIEITGQLLQCLRPGAWLNDEVINVYLELLKEREKKDPKKFLKCHFFNTFFYKKLVSGNGYDYKSVRRWTTQRKLGYGLIECDKIFVPVHKEIHWCLAVINKKEEKFQYLDSLKGRDSQVFKVLPRYYVDEVKDKSGKVIDVSSWKHEFVEDLPEQENGFDCGVFMIKYADFYSRGLGLCFSQEHMPYFRLRTAKEILRLRAD